MIRVGGGDTAGVMLEKIRHDSRVFTGSSATALYEHPINKDLIAHFKRKRGDSVSWGIAERIEKYEEDRKKKVLWGADIAALYDQETERELAKEVENRIEEVLSDDAGLLEIRQFLKDLPETERAWDERTCAAAAEFGQLECLKYLHENGCPWDVETCAAAAEYGHLECLKYAHENGCPCDASACVRAAEGNSLECLKYLHENGCPWDERKCAAAAWRSHLEFLTFVHENAWSERVRSAACAGRYLDCLKYLREHHSRKRNTSS